MIDPAAGALPFAPGVPAATAEEALLSRRSVRAFKSDPVPLALVEEILALASRAPSGTNIQPWKVRVLAGAARDRLSAAILEAYAREGPESLQRPYNYYPVKWREPYLGRRRKLGWEMYGLLGISRDNKAGMDAQYQRNYKFFDAPVALIFTLDADMELGSWLDYGMFLQSIMIAARARGLDTCPQAAFTQWHRIIAAQLGLPASEMVVCGMSLGHADPDAPENALVTEREPVAGFTRFLDR